MSNNKETTALNEHLEWLKQELQRVIDDGESESWVYAYKRAIKNAESLIEKEKKQIISAITTNWPSYEEIDKEDTDLFGKTTAIYISIIQCKAFKQGAEWMRDKIQGGNNEQQ